MANNSILADFSKYVETTLEELQELGDNASGLKLLVKCHEATYFGICNHIIHKPRQLLLDKVVLCGISKRIKLFGTVFLFYHDIITISIVGVDRKFQKRLWKENYDEQKMSKLLMMSQVVPPSLLDEDHNEIDEESSDETRTNPSAALYREARWKIIESLGDFDMIDDDSMWLERPLAEDLVVFLFHSVIFLKELRNVMVKTMLSEFEKVNKVFVGSIRDESSVDPDQLVDQIVPPAIQSLFQKNSVPSILKKSSNLSPQMCSLFSKTRLSVPKLNYI